MPGSVAVTVCCVPQAVTKTTRAAIAATRDPIRCIELPPRLMVLYLSTLLDGSNDPLRLLQTVCALAAIVHIPDRRPPPPSLSTGDLILDRHPSRRGYEFRCVRRPAQPSRRSKATRPRAGSPPLLRSSFPARRSPPRPAGIERGRGRSCRGGCTWSRLPAASPQPRRRRLTARRQASCSKRG